MIWYIKDTLINLIVFGLDYAWVFWTILGLWLAPKILSRYYMYLKRYF